MRWWILSVALLGGCSLVGKRGDLPLPDPFCDAGNDVAVMVTNHCAGTMSQPDLAYPQSGQEMEGWLEFTFADDQDTLLTARADCISPKPWSVADMNGVDCGALDECLSADGVTFPDPWPTDSYADVATPCYDPNAPRHCGQGDVDCPPGATP